MTPCPFISRYSYVTTRILSNDLSFRFRIYVHLAYIYIYVYCLLNVIEIYIALVHADVLCEHTKRRCKIGLGDTFKSEGSGLTMRFFKLQQGYKVKKRLGGVDLDANTEA